MHLDTKETVAISVTDWCIEIALVVVVVVVVDVVCISIVCRLETFNTVCRTVSIRG